MGSQYRVGIQNVAQDMEQRAALGYRMSRRK